MSRYLLVDGNNLLMRAAHAAERTRMSTEDGIPTGALLILINMLSRHIREEQPTHVLLAWDGGRSEYRTGLYPAYKAHRGERGVEDERGPFAQAKEFCTFAGIHHVERYGWEADDLIAAVWRSVRTYRPGSTVVILSGDKDLLQLLDAFTTQVRPATPPASTDRWDAARVEAAYGVPPRHLAKALALIGDPGDGVPGIRGIGPVKAAKMLTEAHFSLEQTMVGREPEDLRNLRLWYDLVNLRTMPYEQHGLHVPLPPVFAPTTYGGVYAHDLLRYLDRYMLESVRSRLAQGTLWQDPDPIPTESSATP